MKNLLLLCVLYLTVTTGLTGPEEPHHHPIYRYSCNEDMSVTFKGVNGIVWYFKTSVEPKPSCTILPIAGHNGNFNISPDCLYPDSTNNNNRIVYVSVFDLNEGESTPATTPTPKPPGTAAPIVPVSGSHIFKLTCMDIPPAGVIRYALGETGVKDFEQLHEVYNEVKDVDMRFKEGESLKLPDVSEVYIGDMFYMYIKYMGSQSYDLIPMKCHAYKGTFRLTGPVDTIDLWDYTKQNCLSDTAKNYNLMENFKRINATVVYAKLYGFRLADHLTVDDNGDDVTISCEVKICKGCDSSNKCQLQPTTPPARKKRYADAPSSLHTVHRTITIKDKSSSSNEADTHSVCRTMLTVALLALLIQTIL